ncbi:MAG: S9 family peptidase [Planctomycetia bacterium]|nr:S9 family peptidase [Planctomycetia bacterium]
MVLYRLTAVLFYLFTVSLSAQEALRPIKAEDLWNVKRLGSPSTSPDGQWAVVDVGTVDIAKNDTSSELWLLSTDGKTQKQLTRSGGKNSSPKWSPDGKWIAFLSQRAGDEVTQIYVIATEGGEARRVSRMPMAPFGIKWSNDNKTIYCTAWTWHDTPDDEAFKKRSRELKDNKVQAYIIEEGTFRYWDRWIADGKRPVVWAVDVESGNHRNLLAHCKRHLPPYEASERDYSVSPDGKTLAFVSENVKVLGLDTNHDIYTLDLTKLDAEPVNITKDNEANDTNPVYSPDGKHLAFLRQTTKFFYADRFRLMLADTSNYQAKELTASLDRSCGNPVWLPDSQRIAVEIEDSGYTNIGFVSLDGKLMRPKEPVSERAISFAQTKRVGVYKVSSFNKPPTIYAHGPGSAPIQLEHFNDDLVKQWKLGKVENITYQGADEKDIQMFLVYPPVFDENRKWPLVQMVHGGPHNAFTNDFSFRWNPQVWAAQGWVIAIVNFHGSSGFGQDFTDSITGDMGTKPMTDIMKATEFLCAKPWIDKTRVAAAGASYGGYMMAWLNGHTDFFKTMVCHAGVYNWHSMVASDLVRGRERSLGAPPWGDLTKVDKQNAQRYAANFKTPTLVIHGEKDYRVPVTQGMEYYNTLRQKGVPTRFLYFPDENHWVLKPQNSLLWHKEVFAWISKYIGNGPSK